MPATVAPTSTRLRLLRAAEAELLTRDGLLELGSVARAAGVVPSVVSHHFGSRAGLVCAVVDGFFDALHDEVLDVDLRELGTWHEREHERVRRSVRFHFAAPLAPVVYGRLARDGDVAAAEAARIASVIEASARNITAAQRAGELPRGVAPRLAAAAIFGAGRQVFVAALSGGRRPAQKAVVDQLWRVTAAAVTPTSEEQP